MINLSGSKKALTIGLFLLSSFAGTSAFAGVAVIVNPANNNPIDQNEIARIFLGKNKSFADGTDAIAVDQYEGSTARAEFTERGLHKSEANLKAYWAQLLFTGRGTPPKIVGGDDSVKKLVAENPNLIGYIDSTKVDNTVKVIAEY